jgi:ParB family chromosome partitioning protein
VAPPVHDPPPEDLMANAAAAPASPALQRAEAPRTGEPVFIVDLGEGRTGRLVVHRRAAREGWALVACATGREEAVVEVEMEMEVEVTRLRIIRIA